MPHTQTCTSLKPHVCELEALKMGLLGENSPTAVPPWLLAFSEVDLELLDATEDSEGKTDEL